MEKEHEKTPNKYWVTIVALTWFVTSLLLLGIAIIPLMNGVPVGVPSSIFVYGWAMILMTIAGVCAMKGKAAQNSILKPTADTEKKSMDSDNSIDSKWTAIAKLYDWAWKILVIGFCGCILLIAVALLVYIVKDVIARPGYFFTDAKTLLVLAYLYASWYILGTMNILIEKATGIDISAGIKAAVKGNN